MESTLAGIELLVDHSKIPSIETTTNNVEYKCSTTINSLRLDSEQAWVDGNLRAAKIGASRGCYQPRRQHGDNQAKSRRLAQYEENLHGGSWRISCQDGLLKDAVEIVDLLVQRGSHVTDSVLYGVIKRCIAQKDLVLGSRVHALAVKSGYESNTFLANHIICMYAAHGRLEKAMQVFTKVPSPNCYMWASIILAHARHEHPAEAIELYRQMRSSAVKPNSHIFVAALKACATAKDLSAGKEVHGDLLAMPCKPNSITSTCLVDMYSKCGSLIDARRVFDKLLSKDVVTWNAMIAGYAQHGHGQEALNLYAGMQQEGIIRATRVTFLCLLQACASIGALQQGKQLHAQIRETGLGYDAAVGNCLVNMYAKCGSLIDARKVFDHLANRDVVTWNAMITGYAHHGLGEAALTLYDSMQQEGVTTADAVTFVCLLKACASIGALHRGKQLHAQIQKQGLQADLAVGNSMISMYAKCGSLEDARIVFDSLPKKDVVTWTAMIAGYAQHGLGREALTLYANMEMEGMTVANRITFLCLLQACASVGDLHQGKQLHAQIQKAEISGDFLIQNCLIDMYAKCGSLKDAHTVFSSLPSRDVVAWNALIAGYAQHGRVQEALTLYRNMKQEGSISADAVTFICLLQACGSVAGLEKGKEIHAEITKNGLEARDLSVGNSLVDMYGKCGSMVDAQQMFDALPRRDVVTWNALIAGYARQGQSKLVFDSLESMRQEGVVPNDITLLSVVTVCSHAGMVEEGLKYFEVMRREFDITATTEHYNCMVDLLGRAGQLDKAMEMVKMMPFEPDGVMWRCVLSACQKWRNVELGREAFEFALKLDKNDAAAYVLMSNIYAGAQLREEVKEIQAMRLKVGAWKKPGQSWWTDLSGTVHTFLAGDSDHADRQQIDAKLEDLYVAMKLKGYVPHFDSVLRDIPVDEKETALCGHSEKLAIAHALLNTPKGTTIRVVKNLRVCEDCHTATALISTIEMRTIICRDASRFHVFKDGKCSCGGYW